MKRCFIFFMVVLIIFNSFPFVVFANSSESDESSTTTMDAYTKFIEENCKSQFFATIISGIGVVGDLFLGGNWENVIDNALADIGYISYADYVAQNYNPASDSVDISAEFVANFNLELNNYLEETYGYKVYPACVQNETWVLNHLKYFGAVASNPDKYSTWLSDCNLYFTYVYNPNQFWDFTASADEYLVKERNAFDIYDSELNKRDTWHDWCYAADTYEITVNYGNYGYNGAYVNYYYFKNDTKVFNSVAALNEYLHGEKVIYQMGGIGERIQDLTFTVNALNADWQKINQESLDAIVAAIKNKQLELEVDTLTESELQAVIDSVISSRLEEINKTIQSGNDMNSFQNQLIYQKLDQIYKLLYNWYNDPVAGALNVDITPLTTILADIKAELTLIHASINNFDIDFITNNTFNTDFDTEIVITNITPAIEMAKDKFPLCIPWDILEIFKLLAHEPEAPAFVMPFDPPAVFGNVEPIEVKIDLSDFDMLSDISRSLGLLLFILALYKLTIKIKDVM